MVVKRNKLIARTPTQYTLFVNQQVNEAASLWGVIDSNYYARPIDEGATIAWYKWNYSGAPGTVAEYDLINWQDLSGYDAHTVASPIETASDANIELTYNASASEVPVTLTRTYKDVANTVYPPGPLNLEAFSGEVLIFYPSILKVLTDDTGKIMVDADGKVWVVYN